MRVKTGIVRHRKHKKILDAAKGMRMTIHKRFKLAKQAELHAGEYAFHGRKRRKRDFRTLWIQRINAGLTSFELSYSVFMDKLKKANISLNRKMLAELALHNPNVFEQIVKKVK
ncbi:50S ribosomal protein L20 [Candidatus Beckwithbacteria bacterium]|nr:50S ribosomal protein L20 [Candidatus Beckwithbacteria bacterium]